MNPNEVLILLVAFADLAHVTGTKVATESYNGVLGLLEFLSYPLRICKS